MNAFNPADFNPFANTTRMSDKQVQRLCQRDDIDHAPRVPVAAVMPPAVAPETALMVQWLEQAAARYAIRRDNFAFGKEATCLDIAAKLQRFGSFASDRQEDFARKLVEWSLPRGATMPWEPAQTVPQAPIAAPVAPTPAPAPETRLDRLFALMQRLSKLTIGELTIARKNQDSLCWVKVNGRDGVIGKIEGGKLVLFAGRIGNPLLAAKIHTDLLTIEADPEAAAVLHGKLSGRCAVCSRDLTDPESIARGIGPVCITKAGW